MKSFEYSHALASSTKTCAALQKFHEPLKEQCGERKNEIDPTILALVGLNEWLRVRLRTKSSVNESLTSLGKPLKSGRTGKRRPPRKRN